MKLLLPFATAFALLQTTTAYWTVVETPVKRYGEFWADLSYFEFNGNSSVVKCQVGTDPYQDKTSIIYEENPAAYVGCLGTPSVGLRGNNRVLHSLAVLHSTEVFNCVLLEQNPDYKQYVCGNAIAIDVTIPSKPVETTTNIPSKPVETITTIADSSTRHTTTTFSSAKPTSTNCLPGYRGKRNGQGPNGACCSHSDDCLDTCVRGVCGVVP